MSEYDLLIELTEILKLQTEKREMIAAAEKRANSTTEQQEVATATEETAGLVNALAELSQNERTVRDRLARQFVAKNESKAEEPTPQKSSSSTVSFKLPQPQKFKRGDNFHLFCENFKEYVTLSKLDSDDLSLLFLQLVDEQTKMKLKQINLEPGQRRNATSFLEIFEKKMAPAHESRTFKSKLADLSQTREETVEEFAFRIVSTASRAYPDRHHEPIREEACYNTLMRGITDPYIKRRLHEDPSVDSFDKAAEEGSRLEIISQTLQTTSADSEENSDDLVVVHAIDNVQNKEATSEKGRSSYRRKNSFDPRPKKNSSDPHPQTKTSTNEPIVCYRCQGPNHIARHCRAPLN